MWTQAASVGKNVGQKGAGQRMKLEAEPANSGQVSTCIATHPELSPVASLAQLPSTLAH